MDESDIQDKIKKINKYVKKHNEQAEEWGDVELVFAYLEEDTIKILGFDESDNTIKNKLDKILLHKIEIILENNKAELKKLKKKRKQIL